jgi:hypothetical protein
MMPMATRRWKWPGSDGMEDSAMRASSLWRDFHRLEVEWKRKKKCKTGPLDERVSCGSLNTNINNLSTKC